jgi:hypothetical protein
MSENRMATKNGDIPKQHMIGLGASHHSAGRPERLNVGPVREVRATW